MIYMLYDLQFSEEMIGGPRYTDNELDTEFVELLCIADMHGFQSVLKRRGGGETRYSKRPRPLDAALGSGSDNHDQRKRRRPPSDHDSGLDSDADDDRHRRFHSQSVSNRKQKRSYSPGVRHSCTKTTLRALRQERAATRACCGRAPCVRCSRFDFCQDGGLVNPQERL
ncbi:hypothetical protein OH76DRAFT_1090026 [Lentinus brumalis]|uniref:Uncharacterized protein n=1 Tax=Lentinus brumalis TaxID=2498619 RepID=A0A371CW71_9APHY|nr:hypothetical protein OH76DRAFT_1090026 [Polyporus brumalis]